MFLFSLGDCAISNSRHLNFISIRGCVNGTFRQELWNWKNWALSWVFSKCNQFHDFTRFHVIFSRANATVWKNEKFSALQIFFRQINLIVKFFSKTLIWRNFCEKTVAVKFWNFHSVCALVKSFLKEIPWNQLFIKIFRTSAKVQW